METLPKDSTDTRERILVWAKDLFRIQGYQAVAVSDIAEKCDISTSLIYYHFKDKESLMRALTAQIGSDLVEPTLAILSGNGSSRERLTAFIEAWVIATYTKRVVISINLRPLTQPESPFAAECFTYASQTVEAIAAVIANGMYWGEFDPVDPMLAAECLLSLVNTRATVGAMEAPHDRLIEADAQQTAAFISTLFMDGICSC